MRQKRQLRTKLVEDDLKDWFEFRLLQGLNGRIHPKIGKPKPDAQLPRDASAIKRIQLLLQALQAASSSEDSFPGLGDGLGPLSSRKKFLEWANSDLKRYLQFPVIFVDPFSNELTTEMENYRGDEWENDAVNSILLLLKSGELYRLKRCFCCEKWFYSLRDDQRFCNRACRQKQHSQSGAFKENRKEYMRKYREKGDDKRAKSRT